MVVGRGVTLYQQQRQVQQEVVGVRTIPQSSLLKNLQPQKPQPLAQAEPGGRGLVLEVLGQPLQPLVVIRLSIHSLFMVVVGHQVHQVRTHQEGVLLRQALKALPLIPMAAGLPILPRLPRLE